MPSCFDGLCVVDPSPAARQLLWHIRSVGVAWRDEPETHAARDKAGVFLFWVISGSGVLHVAKRTWELQPGPQVWLVDLKAPRAYVPNRGQRLVTAGLRFAGPSLNAWQVVIQGDGEFHFSRGADCLQIHDEQQNILALVTRRPAGYEWQVHESLTRILGRLLAQREVFSATSSEVIPAPVKRVLNAVLEDPSRGWRAAELARVAGISYSGLRSMFREVQQESLSSFLRRMRLQQTQLLLANVGLSIKEVAARMEFSSEFYFSQWYRRQTGESPTTFRRSLCE